MSPSRLVAGALGVAVGAAAVVGGSSLFLTEDVPRAAITVAPGFCDEALSGAAGRWGMTVSPQETVTGERDELTACAAASASGDVRLTLTVLGLVEEAGRDADERTSTMLDLVCTSLHPGDAGETRDGGCDGPVETVDDLVGNATAFVTDDGRAVVTVILTAPPARAAGTGREVAALVSDLSAFTGG